MSRWRRSKASSTSGRVGTDDDEGMASPFWSKAQPGQAARFSRPSCYYAPTKGMRVLRGRSANGARTEARIRRRREPRHERPRAVKSHRVRVFRARSTFDRYFLPHCPARAILPPTLIRSAHMRASPSGKAPASQAGIRGFESRCPLHCNDGRQLLKSCRLLFCVPSQSVAFHLGAALLNAVLLNDCFGRTRKMGSRRRD